VVTLSVGDVDVGEALRFFHCLDALAWIIGRRFCSPRWGRLLVGLRGLWLEGGLLARS
jgi:hypothetical protein